MIYNLSHNHILIGSTISLTNRASSTVMIFWLLGATVISYGFTCIVISVLTVPIMEKPMQTWQDLLDNDYTILTLRYEFTDKPGTHFSNFLTVCQFFSQLQTCLNGPYCSTISTIRGKNIYPYFLVPLPHEIKLIKLWLLTFVYEWSWF